MNRLIIVKGLPCSGKSTFSKYISDRLNAVYYDVGSGSHPADCEFHAFIPDSGMSAFSDEEQARIKAIAESKCGGHIVPLGNFGRIKPR